MTAQEALNSKCLKKATEELLRIGWENGRLMFSEVTAYVRKGSNKVIIELTPSGQPIEKFE